MGVASTLRVTRDQAILALARAQYANMSDEELENRVDDRFNDGNGDALYKVNVNDYQACTDHGDDLKRLSEDWQ